MNLLMGQLPEELRKLLRTYVTSEGLPLGKNFFASHVREIERLLIDEIERDIRSGKIQARKTLQAG